MEPDPTTRKRRLIFVNLVLVIIIIAAAFALSQAKKHNQFLVSASEKIGHDLITSTNSGNLDRVGWGLHQKLNEFLDPQTRVVLVEVGDPDPPTGSEPASTRLFLTNGRGESLGIRLRQDSEKFHVIGFWIINGPIQTNR